MPDPLEQRANRARARVVRASTALHAAQTERDEVVTDMHTAGWSLSRIAEALGISKERAAQIVRRLA